MTSDLLRLKNIGPASVRQLKEVDIEDAATLRKLGALAAYQRLKHAFPREVSLLMLYALEGALRDCHWNHLPPGVKEQLQAEGEAARKAVELHRKYNRKALFTPSWEHDASHEERASCASLPDCVLP